MHNNYPTYTNSSSCAPTYVPQTPVKQVSTAGCCPKVVVLNTKFTGSGLTGLRGQAIIDVCTGGLTELVIEGGITGVSGLTTALGSVLSTSQAPTQVGTLTGTIVGQQIDYVSDINAARLVPATPTGSVPVSSTVTGNVYLSPEGWRSLPTVLSSTINVTGSYSEGGTPGVSGTVNLQTGAIDIDVIGIQGVQTASGTVAYTTGPSAGTVTGTVTGSNLALTVNVPTPNLISTGTVNMVIDGVSYPGAGTHSVSGNTLTTNITLTNLATGINLLGDVTGPANSNTVTKIQGLNVPASGGLPNQYLAINALGTAFEYVTPNDNQTQVVPQDTSTVDVMVSSTPLSPTLTEFTVSAKAPLRVLGVEVPVPAGTSPVGYNFRTASGAEISVGAVPVTFAAATPAGDIVATVPIPNGSLFRTKDGLTSSTSVDITVASGQPVKIEAFDATGIVQGNDTTDLIRIGARVSARSSNKLQVISTAGEEGLYVSDKTEIIDTGASTNITALDSNPTAAGVLLGELAVWRNNNTQPGFAGALVIRIALTGTNQFQLVGQNGTVPSAGTSERVEYFASVTGSTVNTTTAPAISTPVKVWRNGILAFPGVGNDYTVSGTTVTFATALTPDEVVIVSYYV